MTEQYNKSAGGGLTWVVGRWRKQRKQNKQMKDIRKNVLKLCWENAGKSRTKLVEAINSALPLPLP